MNFKFNIPIRNYIIIFFSALLIRLVFAFSFGFYNNYILQSDSSYLIEFADKALIGDFNFDYGRFIASPGYPVFAAVHKIIFGQFWNIGLIISQIFLSSLAVVYIYKISRLLFDEKNISNLATVIYCLFPMTLWYVHTFCQETLFQCLFIFSVYHLIVAFKNESLKALIYSSVLFSFAYLTKSHVLIFSIFIPVIFLINLRSFKKALLHSVIFASICFSFSTPYGIYHKLHNDTYVLSSNGSGFQFYLGNTNAGYVTIVDVPSKNSDDYVKMKDITNTAGYFNGDQNKFDSILALSQSIKQKLFFNESFKWIGQNFFKFTEMKIYDMILFLTPGISLRHYEFKQWFLAFVLSFPLYLLAYGGVAINLKKNFAKHFYVFAIFLAMILFSTVFYAQNRFRTITLEPFYIIYAAYSIYYLYEKYGRPIIEGLRKPQPA